MRNLIIVHLESTSWQRVNSFPSAFPNLRRFFKDAVVYDWFIASATSTRMVLTHLFHSNDYEYDLSSNFDGGKPVVNNPDLFSILRERGYHTDILCLDAVAPDRVHLAALSSISPEVWATNDLPKLLEKFDDLTNTSPFAIYIWNLITHLEHSQTLASFANGLTDQTARACAMADSALGTIISTLESKNLLRNTTIVVYGDHGEDLWGHGFKGGMTHATEPYTDIIHVPLAICDASLLAGNDDRLASTVDIAPTCLQLIGFDMAMPFRDSGRTLIGSGRDFVFSQNFFASQPDNETWGVRKAFSVTDRTYTLLVSSAGLEFYAHRLDPGNHCNLLHFFEIDDSAELHFLLSVSAGTHFSAALKDNPRALAWLSNDFRRLRTALSAKIAAKREYVIEHRADPNCLLDPACLNRINREARDTFFARAGKISEPYSTRIVTDLQSRLVDQNEATRVAQSALNEVLTSTSWRVTQPLRRLKSIGLDALRTWRG